MKNISFIDAADLKKRSPVMRRPSPHELENLQEGNKVELADAKSGERIWVTVSQISSEVIVGRCLSWPIDISLTYGDEVKFVRDNIFMIRKE